MIDPDNIYHVYPRHDLKEHITECCFPLEGNPTCACECRPTCQPEGETGMIIIHNSFDGRENFEPDNDVRKN